mmetsp:Transcript_121093/g.386717  ORF Transcript_121093/g.386717 Transcript_121093/m.386717 type:complete len:213 (-) Transcript_121093:3684-4322(-)
MQVDPVRRTGTWTSARTSSATSRRGHKGDRTSTSQRASIMLWISSFSSKVASGEMATQREIVTFSALSSKPSTGGGRTGLSASALSLSMCSGLSELSLYACAMVRHKGSKGSEDLPVATAINRSTGGSGAVVPHWMRPRSPLPPKALRTSGCSSAIGMPGRALSASNKTSLGRYQALLSPSLPSTHLDSVKVLTQSAGPNGSVISFGCAGGM